MLLQSSPPLIGDRSMWKTMSSDKHNDVSPLTSRTSPIAVSIFFMFLSLSVKPDRMSRDTAHAIP